MWDQNFKNLRLRYKYRARKQVDDYVGQRKGTSSKTERNGWERTDSRRVKMDKVQ